MQDNLMTAIVFAGTMKVTKALKYRNVSKRSESVFIEFAKTKGAFHVNFYDKRTSEFLYQKKLRK